MLHLLPLFLTLNLADAAPEMRKAIEAEPPLRGLTIVALEVDRRDLDHDGKEEWIVAADVKDAAGLGVVNRPTFVFRKDAGGWRKLAYLGEIILAEVVPGKPRDAIKITSRDGARHVCALYRWHKDRYEAATVNCAAK